MTSADEGGGGFKMLAKNVSNQACLSLRETTALIN